MAATVGSEFKVTWSVLVLLDMVLVYLQMSIIYSPITTDAINKVCQ